MTPVRSYYPPAEKTLLPVAPTHRTTPPNPLKGSPRPRKKQQQQQQQQQHSLISMTSNSQLQPTCTCTHRHRHTRSLLLTFNPSGAIINTQSIQVLRDEAYMDFHSSMQRYNDSFVAHMRCLESSVNDPSARLLSPYDSSIDHQKEDEALGMNDLLYRMEFSSMKDYSQLLEYESNQVRRLYF
ncbi:hypothetical protein BDF14DRAFT_1076356 [Spinellus fusiger]|nr:hypothetical protein BDF14DRAFT_1076356 [Spinellus fusiger]